MFTDRTDKIPNSQLNREIKFAVDMINRNTILLVEYSILEKRKQKIYSYLIKVRTKPNYEVDAIEAAAQGDISKKSSIKVNKRKATKETINQDLSILDISDAFQIIWKAYPTKVKKQRVFTYFRKN